MCGGADGRFAQQGIRVGLDPIFPSPSQIFCEEPVVTLTVAPCDHLPVLTYGQWPEVWEGRIYPGRDLFLRV